MCNFDGLLLNHVQGKQRVAWENEVDELSNLKLNLFILFFK